MYVREDQLSGRALNHKVGVQQLRRKRKECHDVIIRSWRRTPESWGITFSVKGAKDGAKDGTKI